MQSFFSTPTNAVVLQLLLTLFAQGSDVWSSGILDVFADGFSSCFLSSCLPFVQHGLNAENYSRKFDAQASNCLAEAVYFSLAGIGGTAASCCISCACPDAVMLSSCLPCAAVAYTQMSLRRKVREMYGISESNSFCGNDFLTAALCLCCNMVQLSHQLKKDPPRHIH
jgi:Cys-rich protein (TIGR01571 family)